MATKPTKTEINKKKASVQSTLKKAGLKMPHGYEVSLRKKIKK